MSSLLLVIVVAALCVLWVRANRQSRQRWLQRLDLPGTWVWEGHDGLLELEGELDHGRYRIRDDDEEEQGEWRLQGHDLVLEPRSGASTSLDLRLFTEGKIGVHGPGRQHRVYVKRRGNIIPLRRPA
jgi:glyoxylase-like metal-dependent hydrolase (beta-lactamase superfamily II)